jgi:AcrR family transcriptional regulator
MPRVSEEHRAARREQILSAAQRCVARQGYHRTTMAQVIEESGLSAGAVYIYFKGKHELIRETAGRAMGGFVDELNAYADSEGRVTIEEAVRRVLARIDELNEPDGLNEANDMARCALHAWSEAARDDDVLEILRANVTNVRQAWERVLRRARRDGTLTRSADVEAMSAVLLGMMPGFLLQGRLLGDIDAAIYVKGLHDLVAKARR